MKRVLFYVILILFLLGSAFSAKNYEAFVEIDHNFDEDEEITCILKTDSLEKEYTFTDSSSYDKNEDFDNYMSFTCDSVVDEIILRIEDREGDELFDENFREVDFVDYEILEYEYVFDIDHNFDTDEIINCDLDLDEKSTIDLEFKESEGDDFEQSGIFFETFSLSCDDKLEEISLLIDDDRNFNVIDSIFEDEDEIEYEVGDPIQLYEIVIEIQHEFEEDTPIECDLVYDANFKRFFEFDEDGFDRIYLDNNINFGEKIDFSCDESLDQITYLVYTKGFDEKLLLEKTIDDTKSFLFYASDLENIIDTEEDDTQDEEQLDGDYYEENETVVEDTQEDQLEEEVIDTEEELVSNQTNNSYNNGFVEGNSSENMNQTQINETNNESSKETYVPQDVKIVFSLMVLAFFVLLILGIIFLRKK